jgi:glycogen debranching enzyme
MALLNSSIGLFENKCLGHIPEILDGDLPHSSKGCHAQSWGSSEFFRILKFLEKINLK